MATPQIEASGQLPPKDASDGEAFSRWYTTAIRRSELAEMIGEIVSVSGTFALSHPAGQRRALLMRTLQRA